MLSCRPLRLPLPTSWASARPRDQDIDRQIRQQATFRISPRHLGVDEALVVARIQGVLRDAGRDDKWLREGLEFNEPRQGAIG